jgi:hypothetical protein
LLVKGGALNCISEKVSANPLGTGDKYTCNNLKKRESSG